MQSLLDPALLLQCKDSLSKAWDVGSRVIIEQSTKHYWLCCASAGFVLYKVLDRVIRIPYIGRYEERYILVTGCDTGFGYGLARKLDRIGCHVFAGCLTEKGGEGLRKVCSDRLQIIPLDVSKTESVRNAYELVKSKLPEGRGLWGVMNNAGILGSNGRVEWMTLSDYHTVMNVNLIGLIDVTTTFLPLVKMTRGRIVNTASVFGRFAYEIGAPYCVSKYGVEAFTDALRRNLRVFGCRAILVEPGLHKTPLLSSENCHNCIAPGWERASSEVKENYGLDYYTYVLTKSVKGFQSMASDNIGDVVDAYEHALLGRHPRARYLVGWDALYFWRIMIQLPEWLSDNILDLLQRDRPLPACLNNKSG